MGLCPAGFRGAFVITLPEGSAYPGHTGQVGGGGVQLTPSLRLSICKYGQCGVCHVYGNVCGCVWVCRSLFVYMLLCGMAVGGRVGVICKSVCSLCLWCVYVWSVYVWCV